MSTWTSEELSRVGEAAELRLASERADRSVRPYVTMWVVCVGDDLYVRSAVGPDKPWYRRAVAIGVGRIRAGGVERDVSFSTHETDVHAAIDAAYHTKYDDYGPQIVGTVVGSHAQAATIHLVSRSRHAAKLPVLHGPHHHEEAHDRHNIGRTDCAGRPTVEQRTVHQRPRRADGSLDFGGFEVNFLPEYKVLHDAGYNLLTYDLRNHGRSGTGSGGIIGHGVLEYRDVIGSLLREVPG